MLSVVRSFSFAAARSHLLRRDALLLRRAGAPPPPPTPSRSFPPVSLLSGGRLKVAHEQEAYPGTLFTPQKQSKQFNNPGEDSTSKNDSRCNLLHLRPARPMRVSRQRRLRLVGRVV